MKLGTLKSNDKDGELVVVSRDNKKAVRVPSLAKSLQQALENWTDCAPRLKEVYDQINRNEIETFDVDEESFHSPLPRAYQWLDGSAYIRHIVLVRKARGAEPPTNLKTTPLMYQGGSDQFLAPRDPVPHIAENHGLDFEGEVAVILDHVPMGTKAKDAEKYIRLIILVNDVSLRGLIPGELAMGFGFMQSKPSSAFSPFALTPEELGDAWKEGRVHLPLLSEYNGEWFGHPDAGDMHFSFHELIEHAARTRDLTAGTIIGSGTVSNEDESKGSSCLAEKRMLEKINSGEIKTPFMKPGDTIKIEMKDEKGQNLFGTLFQKVVQSEVTEG
ncbi:MAG: fumarylacetoacetate hydrolase family protein [Bdellovibrionota bacterium]|nr:fumarylacetoacetate hydrolase family protein [Bdellovibrionota bacterium]